jgi:hypothetical protein
MPGRHAWLPNTPRACVPGPQNKPWCRSNHQHPMASQCVADATLHRPAPHLARAAATPGTGSGVVRHLVNSETSSQAYTHPYLQSVRRTSAPKTAWPEITPDESASIRQPHWHRHLDGKRPTHGLSGLGHKDGTATTRPSDFPEANFWPASLRVRPGPYFRVARYPTGMHRSVAERVAGSATHTPSRLHFRLSRN